MKLAAITLAMLVVSCGAVSTQTTPSIGQKAQGEGDAARDFSARDVGGKTVRLGPHLGKDVVLLSFWQTWCEPCIAELPHLRRMADENRAKGFVLFGVALDGPETVANVPAFVQRNQLNFDVLLDEDSRIAAIYDPKKSAPLSVLIDRTGKIAIVREGYSPGDEVSLAADIQKALAAP